MNVAMYDTIVSQTTLHQSVNKNNITSKTIKKVMKRKLSKSEKETMKTENVDMPHCQYFVQRKKRPCRMTVRPGRSFCGEHEPKPSNEEGEPNPRVPCPLDPKHTCYASKLKKHLVICNARPVELPPYIVKNVNVSTEEVAARVPLNQIPVDAVLQVVDKINKLYESILEGHIETLPPRNIHPVVESEFAHATRTESSRRHLRQSSRLMWLLQDEGLVQDRTCYVELGAGKGQLSYFACRAWCLPGSNSGALLVDRAALRHKRDNKLAGLGPEPGPATRLRADLADLVLDEAPAVKDFEKVVGVAKHLCGAATDLALRCVGAGRRARGLALATCCHHRCQRDSYVGSQQLQELGITEADFNVMLGAVSWATCGDGRSRPRPADRLGSGDPGTALEDAETGSSSSHQVLKPAETNDEQETSGETVDNAATNNPKENSSLNSKKQEKKPSTVDNTMSKDQSKWSLTKKEKEEVGRRAKALIDYGRVKYLQGLGFEARLCYYVPATVSLENVCIVAKKLS